MSSRVELIEYKFDRESRERKSVYVLSHYSYSKRTKLEQNLTITIDASFGAKPTIEFEDFPNHLSEREAALQLADWMQRLSVAIENHWGEP